MQMGQYFKFFKIFQLRHWVFSYLLKKIYMIKNENKLDGSYRQIVNKIPEKELFDKNGNK